MLVLSYSKRVLRFNFPARTSRGALAEHTAYYLHLHDEQQPTRVGYGEAAPLAGLSPDDRPDFEQLVAGLCAQVTQAGYASLTLEEAEALVPATLPALRLHSKRPFWTGRVGADANSTIRPSAAGKQVFRLMG